MHNLKELKIWNKAIDVAISVYKVTDKFPKEETYGLTSQTRRSAVSISSNIAEGAGRNSRNEFLHFLGIANGSSYELQTQIIVAGKLNLLSDQIIDPLLQSLDELQKMNYSFQKKLKEKKQ
jgi:four helix bundle protein